MREMGQELGVRYLLTGSVRKAGNALRITTQLVEAATDTPLWGEKYSGTMDDVFDVQERVSRAIVDALDVTLSSEEDRRLADRPIHDVRAFYAQAADPKELAVIEASNHLFDGTVSQVGDALEDLLSDWPED